VSRVVPAGDLLAEAERTATEIAAKSLPVLYAAKAALRASQESPLAEGLRFERQAFAAMFALDDQTEGMTAFREKRAPTFTHR
jgi:enoyl-CoA hydratase